MPESNYWTRTLSHRPSRRSVLRGGGALGASLAGVALTGCGSDDDDVDAAPDPNGANGNGAAAEGTPVAMPDPHNVTRGGTLRRSLTDEPPNLDAIQHSSPVVVGVVNPLYDQLVQWDPFEVGAIIPDLAREWEWDDDTTLVFHLTETEFHNGQEFTSEDIAMSLERIQDPPDGVISPRQAQLANINSFETPDDRTLVVNLNTPSGSILSTLAGTEMVAYSAEDLLDDSFDHTEQANGTGPYMLEEWNRGISVRLVRNPNYFEDGDVPFIDAMDYVVIADTTQAFISFTANDVDMGSPPATEREFVETEMADRVTMLTAPATANYVLAINTPESPWTDERTWVAAALAIDKEDANTVISEGRGYTHHAIPPEDPWALSEEQLLQVPGYKGLGDGQEASLDDRRAEAHALFDAAGLLDYEFSLFTWNWDSFESWALVIQDGLEQAGLVMGNLELTDRGTYEQRLAAMTYGDIAGASRGATFPDPSPAYADSYVTGAGRLYNGLTDAEVDDLYQQQEQALDEEERIELAHRMFMRYLEVYPPEISHFEETASALYNYVHGYGELYGGFFQSRKMQWIWLDR